MASKIVLSSEPPLAEVEVAMRRVDHLMKLVRTDGEEGKKALVVSRLAAIKRQLAHVKHDLKVVAPQLPPPEN